jgi:D-inositol-3-phosphate glycosyltransferase
MLSAVVLRPQRREQLAAGATSHARRFSWERTVHALLQVYSEAAAAYRVGMLEREVAV